MRTDADVRADVRTFVSSVAPDVRTCDALLSLALQRRRGDLFGVVCRTVNPVPEDGAPIRCSYCRQVIP